MSLVCVKMGKTYVWWYDGTSVCFERWQIIMAIFALFYVFPFPFALHMGIKLLKQGRLSAFIFVCSCMCPPMAVYFAIKYNAGKLQKMSNQSTTSEVIISVLQGPYRKNDLNMTLYWEAMISIRRLLITAMTLVSYASIRMLIITVLSLVFLLQHVKLAPFYRKASNDAETFSLSLLVLTSVINLLKASLTDSGIVPSGPSVSFFKGVEFCEKLFVMLIITFILLREMKMQYAERSVPSKK